MPAVKKNITDRFLRLSEEHRCSSTGMPWRSRSQHNVYRRSPLYIWDTPAETAIPQSREDFVRADSDDSQKREQLSSVHSNKCAESCWPRLAGHGVETAVLLVEHISAYMISLTGSQHDSCRRLLYPVAHAHTARILPQSLWRTCYERSLPAGL